jgi:hypothetical protein
VPLRSECGEGEIGANGSGMCPRAGPDYEFCIFESCYQRRSQEGAFGIESLIHVTIYNRKHTTSLLYYQEHWSISKDLDFYSGDSVFDSRLGHSD